MEAKLIVVGGDAKVTEIQLKLPTIIGRGRGATLVLPHPLVSRQHCEIYESEGKLYVRDLGSLNGTFIGNELITEAELLPGGLLTVGAVTFRAIYGELLEHEEHAKKQPQDASRKRRHDPTKTRRNEAVETVYRPNADTVRDKPEARPAPTARPAPKKVRPLGAGRETEEAALVDEEAVVDNASVVEEQAEIVQFEGAAEEGAEVADDLVEVAEAGRDEDTDLRKTLNAPKSGAASPAEDAIDEVAVVDEDDAPQSASLPASPASSPGALPESSKPDDELQAFFKKLK